MAVFKSPEGQAAVDLRRLGMPVMARLGGRDVFIDTPGTARRLRRHVPHAEVEVLPDAYHAPRGYTAAVLDFLDRASGVGP